MNSYRIEQLKKIHKEDPTDPFPIYGLALELQKEHPLEAKKYFEMLLKDHESYISTYYHAAALYSELNDIKSAKQVYKKGIELSKKTGEHHALKELNNAYQNFLFENEEEED